LEEFAREYHTKGEKLIAADTLFRMNDKYYGQWLALNVPFKKLEDLLLPDVVEKIPKRYLYIALALELRPDYWREAGLHQAKADMELEAVNRTQIDTVLAMLVAKTHVIDKYLYGNRSDETANNPNGNDDGTGTHVDPNCEFNEDPAQEMLLARGKREIDKALQRIQAKENEEEGDARHEREIRQAAKIVSVTGPPGCGKSTCAKELIRYANAKIQAAGCGKI
jgi:hypothetical protein